MLTKKLLFYRLKNLGSEQGATTILMSFLIMNVLLLVSLTAASIAILNIRMSAEIADSVPAFYAADTGAEWCLYQTRVVEVNGPCSYTTTLSNGASFSVDKTSGENKIKSTGSYKNTSREIELTW